MIDAYLGRHSLAVGSLSEQQAEIRRVAAMICEAFASGGKVLIFGNGGSAADAQHFAAELVGRFRCERQGLAAVALTADPAILTAVGNDYGFEQVFSRQVQALARPGDVVIGITTSGKSANVLRALHMADACRCYAVALTGTGGAYLWTRCDSVLLVMSEETALIQEGHAVLIHLLCALIEEELACLRN